MSIKRKITDLAGSALVAAMLSGALTLILCGALGLWVSPLLVYALCGALTFTAAAAAWSRSGAAIALTLSGLVAAALMLFGGFRPLERMGELLGALMAMGSGEPAMLTDHADTLACAIASLLALTLFWMGRMPGGVYPALTLSLMVMLYGWFMEKHLSAAGALVALAALGAMFARSGSERVSYFKALPAALIIAALAFAALPAGNPTWKPLEDAADRMRRMFYDYFMFTEARASYSLFSDGYQPMGDALGGPADPSDKEVMLVKSDRTLLLRGSIRRTYTTYSWINSAVNNRYLFIDLTKAGARDRIFEPKRLDGLSASDAFEPVSASVTMLSDGISTLFVPHRLTALETGLDMAVYYNNTGEVFITRRVKAGDTYSVAALIPTGDDEAMERILTAALMSDDDQLADARRDYLELPRGIEQGVYDLAREITKDAQTPYRKARAIEMYLLENFRYSLEVDYPPSNRDFVSFFLLSSKEGFCSYFASAMAVMARMADLPCRYVEGYMAPAAGAEGAVITGENAHAWVEIYFQGVGWVPFNPTPGREGAGGSGGAAGGDERPEEDESPEPEQEPTPEPSEEPSEEPSDEPDAAPTQTPDPGESQDDPDQGGESPQPEDTPEPEQPPEDDQSDAPERKGPLWLIWLLLLALIGALAAWVVRRMRASDPARAEKKVDGHAERLALWYRAMLTVLEEQGQIPGPSETPPQFAGRLREAGIVGEDFGYVAEQLALARYAGRKPDGAVFERARTAYRQATGQLKPLERARFLLRRLTRGLGDAGQIP